MPDLPTKEAGGRATGASWGCLGGRAHPRRTFDYYYCYHRAYLESTPADSRLLRIPSGPVVRLRPATAS
eukprot:4164789-Alexandrium_andersonii.AAC.1